MAETRGRPRESRRAARARRERMLRRRRRTILSSVVLLFALVGGCQLVQGPADSDQLTIRTAKDETSPSTSPSASVSPSPGPSKTQPKRDRVVPNPDLEVSSASGKLKVVSGKSKVYGHGPLKRYLVEVEVGLPEDPGEFATAVERTLADPRSWGHGNAMSFQRVDSGPVDFRVTLASPKEVDKLCAVAGLKTEGEVSCFNGKRSVINQNRWETAVPWFDGDLVTYRYYVINHEVGHALGKHHKHCPGQGQLAPVMQEQTYTLEHCRKNGWPYPD